MILRRSEKNDDFVVLEVVAAVSSQLLRVYEGSVDLTVPSLSLVVGMFEPRLKFFKFTSCSSLSNVFLL